MKKLLCLLLALTLVFALAACGEEPAAEEGSEDAESAEGETGTETPAE